MINTSKNNKDILIFAGKKVGLESLKVLIDMDSPISKVIVASKSDHEIMEIAKQNRIPIEIYSNNTQNELIANGDKYKWLLNLWSPFIIKKGVLLIAEHHLNIHPGLVPHCRGQDCAAWAIRNGLPAGVSLLEMSVGVDEGDVYVQKEVKYQFPISGKELHEELQYESINLFRESWSSIYDGSIVPSPQIGPVSYYKRKDTEADRFLDSSQTMSFEEMVRWIMAHDFFPGTTAVMKSSEGEFRINLQIEKITEVS